MKRMIRASKEVTNFNSTGFVVGGHDFLNDGQIVFLSNRGKVTNLKDAKIYKTERSARSAMGTFAVDDAFIAEVSLQATII